MAIRMNDPCINSLNIFILFDFDLEILKRPHSYVKICKQCARIAQSVERPAVNRQVTGSSPVSGAIVVASW